MAETVKERDQNDQKKTMAATWALSLAALEKFPASTALLRLSAFLAPGAIPFELLEKGGKSLPELLSVKLAQITENPQALDELMGPLLRLSLIRRSDETRSYSIHPLMQEVIREELGGEDKKDWAEWAVRAVNASFPYIQFENWPQCDRLLPHALACIKLIELWSMEFSAATRLLNQTGYYLSGRGEYARAVLLNQQALAIREKTLGHEHPDTAVSLANLGELYRSLGRYQEAEPLNQRALAIYEKTLGLEHSKTALSLNNLAILYRSLGRYQEAEQLYQRALAIYEKTLGPEHPDTALSLNNLAALYFFLRRYQEAEPLYQRALAIREKVLGQEHPDIATSLNNLAELYSALGRDQEAEPLHRQALAIREKTLGPEHPDTAFSLNNLAVLYFYQGRHLEAEPLLQRALEISEKGLGAEHPDTVLRRNNLIQFYRKLGRNAEADALEENFKPKTQ